MKKFMMAVIFGMMMLFVGSADAQTVKVPQQQAMTWKGKDIDSYYKYIGPDVDIQVGTGFHYDTADKKRDTVLGMGRLRVGALWIPKYPWALSAGITIELNTLSSIVWGTQVEVMHFGTGFWIRGGVGSDYAIRPHANAAVGWSFFGVEVQGFSAGHVAPYTMNDNREGVAVLGTVRIPLGFIGYVLTR